VKGKASNSLIAKMMLHVQVLNQIKADQQWTSQNGIIRRKQNKAEKIKVKFNKKWCI
jgi:hypothetical protein